MPKFKPFSTQQMGAKKTGLGAQKVKKDFAEIEREAELADQVKDRMMEEAIATEKVKNPEEEAKAIASMRLGKIEMILPNLSLSQSNHPVFE